MQRVWIVMSGKFSGYRNIEELKAFFPIDKAACEVTPNLNISPAQEVLAIIRYAGENRLDKFHWGLVPFWAKDVSIRKIRMRLSWLIF